MQITQLIQILCSFLGSFFFAIIYNTRGKKVVLAAIGGGLSQFIFIMFEYAQITEIINYFITSVIIAIYCEILARIMKSPATVFLAASIIPLLPGGSSYLTMKYLVDNDLDNFFVAGIHTLSMAGAIAMGILFVASINISAKIITKNRKKLIIDAVIDRKGKINYK